MFKKSASTMMLLSSLLPLKVFAANAFDQMDSKAADHALGVCLGYHFSVKNNLDSYSQQIEALMLSRNVSRAMEDEGKNWIKRYKETEDKSALLNEAKESCDLTGLPYVLK